MHLLSFVVAMSLMTRALLLLAFIFGMMLIAAIIIVLGKAVQANSSEDSFDVQHVPASKKKEKKVKKEKAPKSPSFSKKGGKTPPIIATPSAAPAPRSPMNQPVSGRQPKVIGVPQQGTGYVAPAPVAQPVQAPAQTPNGPRTTPPPPRPAGSSSPFGGAAGDGEW